MHKMTFLLSLTALVFACNGSGRENPESSEASTDVPAINFSVMHVYPHDTTAFTEGLLFHEGRLYESTGHSPDVPSSRSLFGVVDLQTGKIQVKGELDSSKYFGEGISFLDDKLYQLTLKTREGFVYDAHSFRKLAEFTRPTPEGWGLTTDGKYLITSDGTSHISYLNPSNFQVVKVLNVTDNNGPVGSLNELELIRGYLYANHWLTNDILKIDTSSGKVVGRLDLSSLDQEVKIKYPDAMEMNGIAYDSASKRTYVTGKDWPSIYEIQFAP
jgi:glutamine cyclotransferase